MTCEICQDETQDLYGCEQCGKMVCAGCQSAIDPDYCRHCDAYAELNLEAMSDDESV